MTLDELLDALATEATRKGVDTRGIADMTGLQIRMVRRVLNGDTMKLEPLMAVADALGLELSFIPKRRR